MASPRTCVIFHNKPGNCTSWGYHGTPGCYIGPSLEHYRDIKCYMPAAVIVRVTDKLLYILKAFSFLKTNTEDCLQQVIIDIIEIIKDPPKTIYFLSYGDSTTNVINQIAHILQRSAVQPRLKILPLPPMLPHIHNKNILTPKITSTPSPPLRVEPVAQPLRVQK